MAAMKCPDCGAQQFYVKDPEDQYTLCEFDLKNGAIVYINQEDGVENLEVVEETETFCNRCAWHGKFNTLK